VFGFNHDAREGFGAGIAEDDAAVVAESGLGFGESAGDFGNGVERGLGFYFYVDDELRVILEAGDEMLEAATKRDERSDFDGGEKAVASGAVFKKDDVAGLFAAENVAAAEHFFEDVAVADVGAGKNDVFAGEDAFETEIGHGSGDDAIAFELALHFEEAGGGEEDAVAVDDASRIGDEERAVGIAIEGDAELGFFFDDALLQAFEMERAAAGVDVAAIGRRAHGDDIGAEGAKEFGAEFVGGAVGAIENDAEAGQARAGDDAGAEEFEIFSVEGFVGDERGGILRVRLADELDDFRFEFFFDGIGKFHACMGEKFYAVIMKRIVRSGDDDAGLEIILADEAGDAWSGDDPREGDGSAGLREA